jgi:hypothetical protein
MPQPNEVCSRQNGWPGAASIAMVVIRCARQKSPNFSVANCDRWIELVPEYRAYTVGGDGHFIGFEPLVCRDNGEAVSKAKQLLDGHDIDVWCAERLVIHLKPKPLTE